MALYHFSAKVVRRKEGRLATQVAAYKLGQPLQCNRSGLLFDYSATSRVTARGIEAPDGAPDWARDHARVWNAVDAREKRRDAQVLREYELALPCELDAEAHAAMVRRMARSLVEEFGVVVGWGIHAPREVSDGRNVIAFLLFTTRALKDGDFTLKIEKMSTRPSCIHVLMRHRKLWADIQNEALAYAGLSERVDHRTLLAQREEALVLGDVECAAVLDRAPAQKLDRAQLTATRRRMRSAGVRGVTGALPTAPMAEGDLE